jgi:hypothetical protein
LSIEYVIITHRESREIIYYKVTGNLEPNFLDSFRSSIKFEILDLPKELGAIEQSTLEGKYLITRSGKMIWITLILNKLPTLFTREVLKFFCEIFENQFNKEIYGLYSDFNGDISIFKTASNSKQSTETIIQDVFHLYLTLPFKMGTIKGKKYSKNARKVWRFITNLIKKNGDGLFIERLFNELSESFKISNQEIADIIFELVQKEILLPISSS